MKRVKDELFYTIWPRKLNLIKKELRDQGVELIKGRLHQGIDNAERAVRLMQA